MASVAEIADALDRLVAAAYRQRARRSTRAGTSAQPPCSRWTSSAARSGSRPAAWPGKGT